MTAPNDDGLSRANRFWVGVTARRTSIVAGLVAVSLTVAVTSLGVMYAFGTYDRGYELEATFTAAGQGLQSESDVKVRGVNVGHVESVEFVDGPVLPSCPASNCARVTLFIDEGQDVPRTASAVVRPKTLFGEKFVDLVPGADEVDGPFMADGDVITDTLGGFELEQVLSDLYPVLQAVDEQELMALVGDLAAVADGLGPSINRQLVNGATVLDTFAANDANTRQFLADLDLLADELVGRAPDLVEGAALLNEALPPLTARGEDLTALLQQASRLSNDLSDLLVANQDFLAINFSDGQRAVDVLFERRGDVVPLVIGVRQYLETLASVIRIPVGDGTNMGAVKAVLGGELCVLGLLPCAGGAPLLPPIPEIPLAGPATVPSSSPVAGPSAPTVAPATPVEDLLVQLGEQAGSGEVSTGEQGILDLLLGGTG